MSKDRRMRDMGLINEMTDEEFAPQAFAVLPDRPQWIDDEGGHSVECGLFLEQGHFVRRFKNMYDKWAQTWQHVPTDIAAMICEVALRIRLQEVGWRHYHNPYVGKQQWFRPEECGSGLCARTYRRAMILAAQALSDRTQFPTGRSYVP